MSPRFPLEYHEISLVETTKLLGLSISAVQARHTRETHPLALRVEVSGKTVAYTGDGEYTEALAQLVAGVDLLIAESYFHSKPVKWHLNYPDITRLTAKRIILTHMHTDMLGWQDTVPEQCAYDGLVVEI
jgi:ribonuclease BN (tRNA processing enzyme)